MDTMLLLKFFSVFVFVIALMMLFSWVLKRLGLASANRASDHGRLSIVESLAIDPRRRLVLVKRDDCEHLLLLGPESELVVETGIEAKEDQVIAFSRDQRNVKI